MGEITGIEWTDSTWTPIRARHRVTGKVGWHCTHASDGCRWCYAEGINRRLGTGLDFKPVAGREVEIFLDEKMLQAPIRWRKPRMVFVCSMTDLFADFVTDEMIDQVFAVMALAPQHTFQVLSKRSERMLSYLSDPGAVRRIIHEAFRIDCEGGAWMSADNQIGGDPILPLSNVWLGFSAEDQPNFTERADAMKPLADAGWIVWCSAEPLIGPIFINPDRAWLRWLVVGGESGPKARPLWTPWIRNLVRQGASFSIPILVKQLGANVQDRNDAGFDGCEPDGRPDMDPFDIEHDLDGTRDDYQGAPVRIRLKSRKGGDMAEWPEDLRVRQFPAIV